MSTEIDLGHLRLACPSTGLTLALSNTARFSSSVTTSAIDNLTVDQLISSSIWISHGANMQLLLLINWPNLAVDLPVDLLKDQLLAAFRHAALWKQLRLSPSLTIEPSTPLASSLKIVVSLLPLSAPIPRNPSGHRLGLDAPPTHLKPPEGFLHLTLDQVFLHLEIMSKSQTSGLDLHHDTMLFEDTSPSCEMDDTHSPVDHHSLLESRSCNLPQPTDFTLASPSTEEAPHVFEWFDRHKASAIASESGPVSLVTITNLVDAAFRLSISKLPSKSTPGVKITETSSFRHLEDICPAVWSPGHLQAMASRAVFLPTISHAISHSVRKSARSQCLKAKLDEIAHQELSARQSPQSIQSGIYNRLWRMMQRRLHDKTAAKRLVPLKAGENTRSDTMYGTDTTLSPNLEAGRNIPSQRSLDDNLEFEYGERWEDLLEDTGECGSMLGESGSDLEELFMTSVEVCEVEESSETPCDLMMGDCFSTTSTMNGIKEPPPLLETMQGNEDGLDDPDMLCSW